MGRIHNLPLEAISLITRAVSEDEDRCTALKTLKSLSGTCTLIRSATLPSLWSQANISIDFKDLEASLRKICAVSVPKHSLHAHIRRLDIKIGPQYEADGPFELAELDSALASAISNFRPLTCLHILGHSPGFKWPITMQAVVHLENLEELCISGCIPIYLPPSTQKVCLKRLTIDSAYGVCSVDLECYPALEYLTVAMEDIEPINNWERLDFPTSMWRSLTSLRLRGYCRSPSGVMSKISESTKSMPPRTLKMLELRLMREPHELDQALDVFQGVNLTSLALTLPFLPDALYCDRLAKAYPELTELMLSGLCHSAAWTWPDTPILYAKAFSALRNLRVLVINHIEEQDAWDMANVDDSVGPKFVYVASEEGLQRREAFAGTLLKHGPSLQNVEFLPEVLVSA